MGGIDERALFNRGPVVVFKWQNAEGWPVEYVSENAAEVFGHEARAFATQAIAYADVLHPDDLARVGEEVAVAAASSATSFVHLPYRIIHADGTVRWLHDVTQILRGDDDVPTHFLGYVVDITEHKRVEEANLALERQLLHAQKLESIGLLAGGVAHDFNNLLTGILGETSLARRHLDADQAELDQRLERVSSLAMRAAELTGQLLAYSGKGRFVVEPTSLPMLVREMTGMLGTVISKKAALDLELSEVPSVRGDRAQLQQIVMNLITNASEALEDKPGRITLRTRVVSVDVADDDFMPPLDSGSYVALEVADEGVGMSEEQRERLFEPFFTTKAQGRGLGMSAVLGILRGHAGGIRVSSRLGEGSLFSVLLPVCDEPSAPRPSPPSKDGWRGRGTVLVVDDEPTIRKYAERVFEEMGFATVGAEDGAKAVARFRESAAEISLVLLDLMMPVKDGAETLVALRATGCDVPVIMCSGYDRTDAFSRVPREEVAVFVQKPYLPEVLERAARSALSD